MLRGGGYSFVACLSTVTTDHASLLRWCTGPLRRLAGVAGGAGKAPFAVWYRTILEGMVSLGIPFYHVALCSSWSTMSRRVERVGCRVLWGGVHSF